MIDARASPPQRSMSSKRSLNRAFSNEALLPFLAWDRAGALSHVGAARRLLLALSVWRSPVASPAHRNFSLLSRTLQQIARITIRSARTGRPMDLRSAAPTGDAFHGPLDPLMLMTPERAAR